MDFIRQSAHREIDSVINPTVAAFAPLLKKKRSFIRQTPVRSFKYTSSRDARAELDIYYPDSLPKPPILVFVYGGGFNTGDKSLSPKTFGLVYANLASYFARRGYLTVIPDYRLVPHATFPDPAHDIRDALHWLIQNPDAISNADTNNFFIIAHSAGAAHIATMLFSTDVLPKTDPLRQKIKAVVLQSPPYDLSPMSIEWPSAPVHAQYWTSLDIAKQNDPCHLFQSLDLDIAYSLPSILMLQAEFEPDWLIHAGNAFHAIFKERTGQDLHILIAKGHNHISINWALSSGEGEQWAQDVLVWFDKLII